MFNIVRIWKHLCKYEAIPCLNRMNILDPNPTAYALVFTPHTGTFGTSSPTVLDTVACPVTPLGDAGEFTEIELIVWRHSTLVLTFFLLD